MLAASFLLCWFRNRELASLMMVILETKIIKSIESTAGTNTDIERSF
jgi:hypothetical protein